MMIRHEAEMSHTRKAQAFAVPSRTQLYFPTRGISYNTEIIVGVKKLTRYVLPLIFLPLFGAACFGGADFAQAPCAAPEIICKAAANQDRSLYVRDRCRYEQKITVERFKLKDGKEAMEEVRETVVVVQPAVRPDKTGNTPVDVRVISDTDKKGNPKGKVNADDKTLLSFGAVWDLAFFPLLPEKLKNYNFQEVVAERNTEKWYRFVPKPE